MLQEMVGVDIPEGDEGEPGKQQQISTRKFFGGQIWNAPFWGHVFMCYPLVN